MQLNAHDAGSGVNLEKLDFQTSKDIACSEGL